MELTARYLKERFRWLNQQYFGGELPEPRLVVSNSRTQLGQFSYRRRRKGLLGWESYGHTIKVSEYYEQTADEIDDTLLHEMIHYWLHVKGIRDTSPHGPKFRQEMARLNRLGRHLTVSARTTGMQVSAHNVRAQYLLLLIDTWDGRQYISVVNPTYRRHVDRQAAQSPLVQHHEWLVSSDPYFATFPMTRSLRGRALTAEIRQHVAKITG